MNEKVLLVDDESEIRALLKLALEANGYRVSEAESGAQAKRRVEEDTPDLIISDLHLDDIDGLDLIQDLKARLPHVPVILLTGTLFDPAAVDSVILKRVSVYIQKTAPLRYILGEVRRLLSQPEGK